MTTLHVPSPTCQTSPHVKRARPRQQGASLIVVMLILIVVSALGIGAAQISMMGERSARNDRDTQMAWQAAEAALMDAEFEIRPSDSVASPREGTFGRDGADPNLALFSTTGCGNTATTRGLCDLLDESLAATTKQKWLTADFTITGSNAETVEYGEFTGRQYVAGNTGVKSAQKPRYMIEPIKDQWAQRDKSLFKDSKYLYRVTAMGFGPRVEIQAVAQMILRP